MKFSLAEAAAKLPIGQSSGVSLVIWTTTPWTLPSNLAIAVHPDLEYVALEVDGQTLLVVVDFAEWLCPRAPTETLKVPGRQRRPAAAIPGSTGQPQCCWPTT